MAVFNNQLTTFLIMKQLAFMRLLWLQHVSGQYHYCHFGGRGTERLGNLQKSAQLGNAKARIQTRAVCLQYLGPSPSHLLLLLQNLVSFCPDHQPIGFLFCFSVQTSTAFSRRLTEGFWVEVRLLPSTSEKS